MGVFSVLPCPTPHCNMARFTVSTNLFRVLHENNTLNLPKFFVQSNYDQFLSIFLVLEGTILGNEIPHTLEVQ